MRSDNKADLEKLADRIRDSKDKALVRELLVRVQKLHRLTLAYYMFSGCSCNSRRSRRRSTTPAVDDAACRYFCMFRSHGRCDWSKVNTRLEADGLTAPDGKSAFSDRR